MTFVRPVRLGVRAVALSLLGLTGLPVLTAAPAAAQYYDDDNGPDDGAYDDRRYDRQYDQGYDDGRYDRGDSGQPWDTSDDAAPGDDVDVSFFHDELRDDGRWISHRDFGYVWSPNNVDDDWRPYTRGHWVNTDDYGWYWVSEEPWGWATYHYGRWFLDDRYGWLWVPGSTWGPAWVAWRSSDSYVGWAPLPPDAYWSGRGGLRYDSATFESPRFAAYWSFVEPRYISTPSIYRYTAPRHRARTIIYSTRPQTRYDYRGDRIVNVGISVNFFDRFLPSPLRSVRVYTTESRYARGFDRQAGNSVRVWRPDLRRQYRDDRSGRDRKWAAGTWRNVDRPARRGSQPVVAPAQPYQPSMMGRPILGLPPVGLPPSGRATYTRPPAAAAPPPVNQPRYDGRDRDRGNWDRGDRGRDDGRNRGGRDDGRSARGTPPPAPPAAAPPAAAPLTPPTAATPPPQRPNGNWSREDRGRDDGRPGRNAPPAANAPNAPRPNAATNPPAPPNAGPNAGQSPRAFDPARRPARGTPAKAPPPAATPPAPPATTAAPPAAAPQPPAAAKTAPAPVDPVANVRRSFTGAPQGGARQPLR